MPTKQSFMGFAKKTEPEIIDFFSKGTYHFTVTEDVTVKRAIVKKRVYIGQFSSAGENANNRAPKGCKLDTPYCLKCYEIDLPLAKEKKPQNREYLDMLPFEGEHIREIICLDENAEKVVKYLMGKEKELGDKPCSVTCMTIEPCYTPYSAKYFPKTQDKLTCLLQIVKGLRELHRYDEEKLRGITAHRDLKFKNVMLEDAATEFPKVRLIDFASVKAMYNADADATAEAAFSPNNTAPEDLNKGIPVGEKTDVFALGLMLTEIFGIWSYEKDEETVISNPLYILFEMDKVSGAKDMKSLYKNIFDRNMNGKNPRWLEAELKSLTPFWERFGAVREPAKALFESATRLIYEDRISLDGFEEELKKLVELSGGEAEEEARRFSLFLFDTQRFNKNRPAFVKRAIELLGKGDISPVLIDYSSRRSAEIQAYHGRLNLVSDETVIGKYQLTKYIEELKDTTIEGASYSELYGLLYHLAGFVSHEKRAELFSGEIHIFTHTPPTQNTCCRLYYADESVPGGAEIASLSGAELARKLGCRIYVHSPKGAAEDWYIVKPI